MVGDEAVQSTYAQLQQYLIFNSNYIYTTLFVLGSLLLLTTLLFLTFGNARHTRNTPCNAFTGSNPYCLSQVFILFYCVSLAALGLFGMHIYYYELSPTSWTKLFNQVVICNGSLENDDYIKAAYHQYKIPLSSYGSGAKSSLLRSIGNVLGNHTLPGKDVSSSAFAMGDGSFISADRPPLLDYRNLFTRQFPYIYFTLSEQMRSYLQIGNVQFLSMSLLTSAVFITLSSLRATLLTSFPHVSNGGVLSTSGFVLLNLYGISRMLIFPIIDLWSKGGIFLSDENIIEYFISFDREGSRDDDFHQKSYAWPIGCLKHYITIIERLVLLVIIGFILGKLAFERQANQKYCVSTSPHEVVPFLLLLQPDKNAISKQTSEDPPAIYSHLKLLRLVILWNVLSHVCILSLSLSYKQLALLQYPVLADCLSLSTIASEVYCVLFLHLSLSSLTGSSSLFWRTPSEQEHDKLYKSYSKYDYAKKLDVDDPQDLEDAFDEINTTAPISRAIYRPPTDYELPVWAKEG